MTELDICKTNATIGGLSISYCPVVDVNRHVVGTRLSCVCPPTDAHQSIGAILQELAPSMPSIGKSLMIGVFGAAYDETMLQYCAAPNLIIEIPGPALHSNTVQLIVSRLHERGIKLALRGRSTAPVPLEYFQKFENSIIQESEDLRKREERKNAPPPMLDEQAKIPLRRLPFMITGVGNQIDEEAAFSRGAKATIGWIPRSPDVSDPDDLAPSSAVIQRLLNLVGAKAPVSDILVTIRMDPAMLFQFFLFMQSEEFEAHSKIMSLSHAVMDLGYIKLQNWLLSQKDRGKADAHRHPLFYAAVRRALFLEAISGMNPVVKEKAFLTGMFSFMTQMTRVDAQCLNDRIVSSGPIAEGLMTNHGKNMVPLQLIQAIEKNDMTTVQKLSKALSLSIKDVNIAILRSLTLAERHEVLL